MMDGVVGFDVQSGLYWAYIEIHGVEVHSKRKMTRQELEAYKSDHPMARWRRDYDLAY